MPTEHNMRFIVLILCFSYVCCQVADVKTSSKSIIDNIGETTTKLITSSKKTEKRDSSDQTSVAQQIRDEPFRPIYRPLYYANAGFRPTVNTYEAAAASPQAYYDKAPEASSHSDAAQERETYRGPYTSSYKEPVQQEPHHNYVSAEQSQEAHGHATPSTGADGQQPQSNIVYERVPVSNLHYNHLPPFMLAQRHRVSPFAAPHPAGQQPIQYIIAIPLSYARQLQQQLSHIPMHASQAYALPVAMPPHHSQPAAAAATQTLAYRPFQYALPQSHGAIMHVEPTGEPTAAGHRYIQIPSSMIYAAAQAATVDQKPAAYQPTYYQHAQPIYQAPSVGAAAPEVPHQQSLYAYQLQVPQAKHQQQQQQQQPHAQYVQIGGGKSALKSLGYYVHATPAHQHDQQQHPQQHQHAHQPSIAAVNPYANYIHGPTPISLLRISAPRALVPPQYLQMQSPAQQVYVRPTEGLTPKLSYATHPFGGVGASYSIVPPSVPYLSQPGAVHYGSHLYHPTLPLTTQATKADFDNSLSAHGSNPTTHHAHHHPHHIKVQPQPSAHQHDNQKQKEASSETSVVKYP